MTAPMDGDFAVPRRTRLYLPGFPYHITQRGNNKQVCFQEPEDYRQYLKLWRDASLRYDVAVHAFCLMTNHVHFLVTPKTKSSISETMRLVGSSYVHYFNRRYERTGTLWEGRHHSSLIQTERYLLTCYLYVELNPVRAGMVNEPRQYPWSSHTHNALGNRSWITEHAVYQRLGSDPASRRATYRKLLKTRLSQEDLQYIRQAAQAEQPLADKDFRQQLADEHGMALIRLRPGRPRKLAEMGTG